MKQNELCLPMIETNLGPGINKIYYCTKKTVINEIPEKTKLSRTMSKFFINEGTEL